MPMVVALAVRAGSILALMNRVERIQARAQNNSCVVAERRVDETAARASSAMLVLRTSLANLGGHHDEKHRVTWGSGLCNGGAGMGGDLSRNGRYVGSHTGRARAA